MSKRYTSGGVLSLVIGLIGVATIEHWMPIWIAAWQFGFALAFSVVEAIL